MVLGLGSFKLMSIAEMQSPVRVTITISWSVLVRRKLSDCGVLSVLVSLTKMGNLPAHSVTAALSCERTVSTRASQFLKILISFFLEVIRVCFDLI